MLSAGRLDIGIGAGWNRPEYDAIGLPFEPVATRVERLTESITVLKGLFGDGPFTFYGRNYRSPTRTASPSPSSGRTRRC